MSSRDNAVLTMSSRDNAVLTMSARVDGATPTGSTFGGWLANLSSGS